jgi:hypothetical protein
LPGIRYPNRPLIGGGLAKQKLERTR